MNVAVVVPTRGDRPYLSAIVEAAQCPVVVVLTADTDIDIPGARVVVDVGPVNIQRWWNRGIDAAGTTYVVVLNDDVTIPPGLPALMAAELERTGASICYAGSPNLTGWAFALNVDHGIRPDERFRWWWGDNDLHRQACQLHGVCHVDVDVAHHHPNSALAAFEEIVELDRLAFAAKWGSA